MAAVNLTTRFSGKVDEVINNGALSTPSINKDYSFVGAKTVKVYSFDAVPLNDYTRSGTSRYGTPNELQDTVQELTMTQDKSFTFTIDKGNATDTEPGVREASRQLRRETDLAIVPALDLYRFTTIAKGAGHKFYATTALTTSTAYAAFLSANEAIDEADEMQVTAGSQWTQASWKCSESTRLTMKKRLRSTAASGTMRIMQFSFLKKNTAHS